MLSVILDEPDVRALYGNTYYEFLSIGVTCSFLFAKLEEQVLDEIH